MENTKLIRSSRIPEMELMKAIAIIGMVLVHVLGESIHVDVQAQGTFPIAFVIGFLGGFPSAGVFMFAMGFGTAFSKRTTVSGYLKRCVTLFVAGVVINLFTQYLRAILVPDVYGPISDVFPFILATDIYFFAALTQLYFALMKKLESKNALKIVISILLVGVCFCISILVPPESFTTGSTWLNTILGFFIRLNDRSYFPFICWIFFPVMGFGAGSFFQKYGMKKTTIAIAVSGVIAFALPKLFSLAFGLEVNSNGGAYYGLHPLAALNGYSIIAAEFLIVRLIMLATKNRLPAFLLTMSKNVAHIYIVQWPLISVLAPVIVPITSIWISLFSGIAILVASYYLGMLLKRTNLINI